MVWTIKEVAAREYAEVLSHKISKTYLSKSVKENGYERVAHGIYEAPDVWPDELYLLQKMNPKIIFSGEIQIRQNRLGFLRRTPKEL